jgi:Peptidase family C25/Propeptide_C25
VYTNFAVQQEVWFMRLKYLILLLTICLCSFSVSAEWIAFNAMSAPGAELHTTVQSSGTDGTCMTVDIPGLMMEDRKQDGQKYDVITIPGAGVSSVPGSPLLPTIRKFVAVPHDADVTVSSRVLNEEILDNVTVWPAQPNYKRGEAKPPFTLNQQLYSDSGWIPASHIRITDDVQIRDFRTVLIEISPVRFDPSTGELSIATGMEIELTTTGGTGFGPESVFPVFHDVYTRNIINFHLLKIRQRSDPEPMLLIAYDGAIPELASFVEWKTKRGLDVTIAPTSETGTSSSAVLSYIQSAYNNWNPKPVYVLFVGDSPQINPLYGIGSCASDYKFTLLAGSDIVPDVFISRISAQNSTELGAQLDKIMHYEVTPETGGWLDHIAGLSSSDTGGMGINDDQRLDEIAARWQVKNPDCLVDRLYDSNGQGTTANITNAVNDGRFWVSYYGHGNGSSWSDPYFANSHVDALVNGYKTPVIMDVSCDNGGFAGSSDCFAEHWMKGGHGSDPHGAVAMYSSSTSTSWDPSAILGWGFCFANCGDAAGTMPGGHYRLGEMSYDAMMYLVQEIGSGSDAQEVMQQYVLFGDCSGFMRSDATITPSVMHAPSAPMAPMPFDVDVTNGGGPIEGATVCALKPGDFQVVEVTDAAGTATLNISPTEIGDMIITVSGENLLPYEAIVSIAPAGCGVIMIDREKYNCDDIITISVSDSDLNVNPLTLDTALADISSDSEPDPETVVLTETGPDTSIFENTIMTSGSNPGEGYLLLTDLDTITAHYHDDSCDGGEEDVFAYATADCQGPVISNVAINSVSIDSAVITWTTDENSDSAVIWGDTQPPGNETADETMTTEHEIFLEGLSQCTGYFFMVTSSDAGGNVAEDDNGGIYYYFMTYQQVIMLEENMDTDPGWTTESDWGWGDPTGQGGEYGSADPNTGFTGNNVYGYNLNGDYPNDMYNTEYLITDSFDCSDASEVNLSFQCWLGVEQDDYDHASIDVSNNGGSSWQSLWSNTDTLEGGSWELWEFDISSMAAGYSNVKIRWGMGETDVGWRYCGWNIDDVVVDYVTECGEPSPTPPPTHTPTVVPPTNTPAPPTDTPAVPPTDTPAVPPTDTPAVPPTNTPFPTNTPVDPTQTPVPPTDTPAIPPTDTPVPPTDTPLPPTYTPEPTATEPPNPDKGMELIMEDLDLGAGDELYLHMYLHNPEGTPYDCDAYILLGVYGSFWCWPSWTNLSHGVDYEQYTVPAITSLHEDILRFTWPGGVGQSTGCAFIGAVFEPGTWEIIGDIQVINWEYH